MKEPLTPKQVLENIIGYNLVGNEFSQQNVFKIQIALKELEASIRKEVIESIDKISTELHENSWERLRYQAVTPLK